MTRRTLTPVGKKRIAIGRRWWVKEGGLLCLENHTVVFLGTGKEPEYDHIHPLAIGGGNEDGNFQPMTAEDHADKSRLDGLARRMIRRATGKNKPKPKRPFPKGRGFGIPGWRKTLKGPAVRI
ncbi:MAG TPA: HNH endonuclease [Marinobacter sp.]|nr:HNH endonuclease [Marinobacter sp.]